MDNYKKSDKEQTSTKKNVKQVDYVLVVKENNLSYIDDYVKNLKVLGLEIDYENGKTVNLVFVKICISEKALKHFSLVYDIGNQHVKNLSHIHTEPIFPHPFTTPLSRVIPKLPGEITEAEKIMIINQILENTKYGQGSEQYGVSKLIRLKLLETAYPLHDGPITEDGLNVRSLLYQHWSNTVVVHKEQPLDLIHRYFGSEIAFYFAWLEYFNIMLIVPSIVGAITFLISIIYVATGNLVEIDEICQDDYVYMCPTCELRKNCKMKSVSKYCSLAQWTHVFDNHFTISFALFMSFWAIIFLKLWRRKENKLKMRWNTSLEDVDTDIRQAYADNATHIKYYPNTGENEPYTPKIIKIYKYAVTFLVCLVLIGIVFVTVLLIVVLKIIFESICESSNNKFLLKNSKILSMSLGSLAQVLCIKVFSKFYGPLSIKLANFENRRTQYDFDNSVLYKRYLLSFTNNYVPLFYLAFLKGRLYTVPHKNNFFSNHVCQPLNCIVGLCMQLIFLMTLKDLAGNIVNIIFLKLKKSIKKIVKNFRKSQTQQEESEKDIPQWEQEYFLMPTGRYLLTTEFTEMIIKYGFVTFFVAAFPLAPLCTLMNNVLELRSDAYKLVKLFRRPVPLSKGGIGAWNGILLSVTYLSTCSNAFVISFTSDWVSKEVYRHTRRSDLSGYMNSTLSKYDTRDHSLYKAIENLVPYCYYRGYRYTAGDPKEYQLTETYWMNLTYKFIAVFIFEHIILVCNAILSYSIPNYPRSVLEQLNLDQQEERASRVAEFENFIEKRGKLNKAKIRTAVKIHRD